ncbi:MAG: hypothetical protein H0W81_12160 [Chloroflexi bacterium]|nr:hypothetical protein [Chloroflexota bacterium]
MDDYTVVVAALAGAAAGALLLRMANARDARTDHDPTPPPSGPPTPTRYARRPVNTAAPILLAVGLALVGVGLAIGSGDGALDVRPVVPGVAVLLAALVLLSRQGRHASPSDGQVPNSDATAAELTHADEVSTAHGPNLGSGRR